MKTWFRSSDPLLRRGWGFTAEDEITYSAGELDAAYSALKKGTLHFGQSRE